MNFEHAKEIARMDHHLKTGGYVQGTLTVRDYFAAKAMQGLAARLNDDQDYNGYAAWAYQMADAMLAAREF
jgi:hypothetical protein